MKPLALFLLFSTTLLWPNNQSTDLMQQSYTQPDLNAIKTLLHALDLQPQNQFARFRIGFLLHKMNRRQEARLHYRKTLDINACHLEALNNLANIQYVLGRKPEAESLYLRAIHCDDNFHKAHYNLANVYRQRHDYPQAIRYYQKTLALKADHARSFHNLALIYHDLKFPNQALQLLERACELAPHDALNRYTYSQLLAQRGLYRRALDELQLAKKYVAPESALKKRVYDLMHDLEGLASGTQADFHSPRM